MREWARPVTFRVLGDLRIEGAAVTAPRDRVVLAVLLLGANRSVDGDTLGEAVWGSGPPATVRTQVQSCVSRLRRALPTGTIETTPEGYRLDLGPEDLDAVRWADLLSSAREYIVRTASFKERAAMILADAMEGADSSGSPSGLAGTAAAGAAGERAAAIGVSWQDFAKAGKSYADAVAAGAQPPSEAEYERALNAARF